MQVVGEIVPHHTSTILKQSLIKFSPWLLKDYIHKPPCSPWVYGKFLTQIFRSVPMKASVDLTENMEPSPIPQCHPEELLTKFITRSSWWWWCNQSHSIILNFLNPLGQGFTTEVPYTAAKIQMRQHNCIVQHYSRRCWKWREYSTKLGEGSQTLFAYMRHLFLPFQVLVHHYTQQTGWHLNRTAPVSHHHLGG